jgi:glycosyltransferase involved in cell wall biosynthesis
MKVLLFGNAPESNAGVRYRLLKFAECLRKDGDRCIVCLPSSSSSYRRFWEDGNKITKCLYVVLTTVRRIGQLRHVPGADVVFFRGSLAIHGYGPPVLERISAWINPRMIFDIDDATWERPDGVTSPLLSLVDFDWAWKMCRICKHAVVGNRYLYDYVTARGISATIIPTCVDLESHTLKEYVIRKEDQVVIGWAGLHTNQVHLGMVTDVLRALSNKHNIVLSIASDRPYNVEGIRTINHRWQLSDAIYYHKHADIGLMPLGVTKSTMGKCAFKALQYMAVGTPCVISPIGMNAEVIQHGVNGFLANTPEEWYCSLEKLVCDPALRERMGRLARQSIIERYSTESHYPAFRGVLELVADAK